MAQVLRSNATRFTGHVNLLLSVLKLAKEDGARRYGRPNSMYNRFKRDFSGKIYHDPLLVAEWVMDFIRKYGVKEYCLSVQEKETSKEIRRENYANKRIN